MDISDKWFLKSYTLDEDRSVVVVRDDKLKCGGSKVRFIPDYLLETGKKEYVYASSQEGHAQVALSFCGQQLGKRITIFTSHRKTPHPNIAKVKALGATILFQKPGYLNVVQKRAREYVNQDKKNRELVPFGLSCEVIIQSIANRVLRIPLEKEPSECWVPVGSGTLLKGLMRAWPKCQFHGVCVGKKPEGITGAKLYEAPEGFNEEAEIQPPYDSCLEFDAKMWRFVKPRAGDGALIWNVDGSIK